MSFEPLNTASSPKWVVDHAAKVQLESIGSDGLDVTYAPDQNADFSATVPVRLMDYLVGLRLLRGLPLSYLVPDIALLPPESIRFFNVDRGWIDRVIDGVLSLANTGSVDFMALPALLGVVRGQLDDALLEIVRDTVDPPNWDQTKGAVTGMLVRSELTRRWPALIVQPFGEIDGTKPMATLRHEPISRDLYIALFAGRPKRIEITEPFTGTRFGVEPNNPLNSQPPYHVDGRGTDGGSGSLPDVPIRFRGVTGAETSLRVLNIANLAVKIGTPDSRMIALHLEQRPYRQVFLDTEDERHGSVAPADAGDRVKLSNGRTMDISALAARHAEIESLVKP